MRLKLNFHVPFFPLLCNTWVVRIVMQWTVIFGSIKVNVERIPEWTKWIAILCITSTIIRRLNSLATAVTVD